MKNKKIIILGLLLFYLLTGITTYSEIASKSVRYQVDENYPPFTYAHQMYLNGFDPDLTNIIFNSADYNLEVSTDEWTKVYSRLLSGEIDTAGIIAITDTRKEEVLFSKVVLTANIGLYTHKDFRSIAVEDLKNLKIGVGKGYYSEGILKDTLGITQYNSYVDLSKALTDLENGIIDVLFENELLIDNLLVASKSKGSIVMQVGGLYPRPHAYAIHKSRPDLVRYINRRLDQLIKNNAYEEIYTKYFYTHSDYYLREQRLRTISVFFFVLISGLALFVFLLQSVRFLRRKLAYKYNELKNANDELATVHEALRAQYDETQSQYEEIQAQYEEIQTYSEKIQKMAYNDYLTDIPNRYALNEKLDSLFKEIHSSTHISAIYYIDLDNFKHVNDTLGHDYGDLLLKQIAHALKTEFAEDCFIARVGGDEFVILKENLGKESQATLYADKILSLIGTTWSIADVEIFVTVSIGITLIPKDGLNYKKIFKNADTAMYAAKTAGKSTYQFFNKQMLESLERRAELEHNIRIALSKEEFKVYYQPYFDGNDTLVGMEALIRWFHPIHGMIPPSEFIPVAEETSLIVNIGWWVIEEVCRQSKEWQEKGLFNVPVAINVSEIQLEDRNFAIRLNEVLEKYALAPSSITIEITESCIMKSMDQSIEILNSIRNMNIKIALDDFGTGYSSLYYLQHLPIDFVKIDKSFVDEIHKRNTRNLIIGDIISIAHRLNLQVVAEGVETKFQQDYLYDSKCDYFQGYLLSKPLPWYEMESYGWKSVHHIENIVNDSK